MVASTIDFIYCTEVKNWIWTWYDDFKNEWWGEWKCIMAIEMSSRRWRFHDGPISRMGLSQSAIHIQYLWFISIHFQFVTRIWSFKCLYQELYSSSTQWRQWKYNKANEFNEFNEDNENKVKSIKRQSKDNKVNEVNE